MDALVEIELHGMSGLRSWASVDSQLGQSERGFGRVTSRNGRRQQSAVAVKPVGKHGLR
jgi:hypothetical protein